jgi:hypothetical protein
VIEAAATEMKILLDNEGPENFFLELLTELPEFHTDILRFLADDPSRPVHVVAPQLCEDCGPMIEEKKYVLHIACRGCGKQKCMEFH